MVDEKETKPEGEKEPEPGKEVTIPPEPEGSPEPEPPEPDEREEELQKLRDDNARLQASLTEQATIRRTLESSYANRKPVINTAEIKEIENLIPIDPTEAMRKMVQYQGKLQEQFAQRETELLSRSRQEASALLEQNRYVEELKSKDEAVALYDKFLGAAKREVEQTVNPVTGHPYTHTEAVNLVVEEFKKTRRNDPLAKLKPVSKPAPTGARGETGASTQPPPPPPEKVETTADIVARENARLAQRRRGK